MWIHIKENYHRQKKLFFGIFSCIWISTVSTIFFLLLKLLSRLNYPPISESLGSALVFDYLDSEVRLLLEMETNNFRADFIRLEFLVFSFKAGWLIILICWSVKILHWPLISLSCLLVEVSLVEHFTELFGS